MDIPSEKDPFYRSPFVCQDRTPEQTASDVFRNLELRFPGQYTFEQALDAVTLLAGRGPGQFVGIIAERGLRGDFGPEFFDNFRNKNDRSILTPLEADQALTLKEVQSSMT